MSVAILKTMFDTPQARGITLGVPIATREPKFNLEQIRRFPTQYLHSSPVSAARSLKPLAETKTIALRIHYVPMVVVLGKIEGRSSESCAAIGDCSGLSFHSFFQVTRKPPCICRY
ncbi:hypothetical protein FS749_004305 [Ceratobasidium sp. UAMH 11750]|nr:hypothetical protein FS749_004305 [Ceratobasidium sp. UAMH 11750]